MKQIICALVIFLSLVYFNLAWAQTARVDLTWESDGYTPVEYSGKPLVITGSNVRVIALSEAADLEYYWRLDDYELPDYSGPGRNSFTFRATKGAGSVHEVHLTLKQGGKVIGTQSLNIPVVNPLLAFYEQDSILGELYSQIIPPNYELPKSEVTLVAEPFFFNRTMTNSLKYTWKLDDSPITPDNGSGRVITFTVPASGGKGTSAVKLLVENPQNDLQYVQNNFSIIFNSLNNGSLF